MKLKRAALFVLLTIFSAILLLAQVPETIHFQARLTEDGVGITGSHEITFSIYETAEDGTPLWSEVQTIELENGILDATIGAGVSLTEYVDFDMPLWLGVTVDDEREMSPRYALGTSPYAIMSKFSEKADSAQHSRNSDNALHSEAATEAESALYSETAAYSDSSAYADSAGTADHARNSDNALHSESATEAESALYSEEAASVPWSGITGMPEGFADGIDNTGSGGISTTDEFTGDGSEEPLGLAEGGLTIDRLDPSGTDGQIIKIVGGEIAWASDIGGGSGDDWGAQVVEHTEALDGDGTAGNPLDIAEEGILEDHIADGAITPGKISSSGALDGEVLKNVGGVVRWASDIGGGAGDDWGSQVVEVSYPIEGDGTDGDPLDIALSGITLDRINPDGEDGQVIKIVGGEATWASDIGGGAGDDWGAQVVEHTAALTGDGTDGDLLGIATGGISTDMLAADGETGQVLAIGAGGGWEYTTLSSGETGDEDWEWTSGSGLSGSISHTGQVAIGSGIPGAYLHVEETVDFGDGEDEQSTIAGINHASNGNGIYGEALSGVGGRFTGGSYGISARATGEESNYGGNFDADGGSSNIGVNVNIDGSGSTLNYGIQSQASNADDRSYAVLGVASGSPNNRAIVGQVFDDPGSYALYGQVIGSDTDSVYAGYFKGGMNYFEGNVGIGTETPLSPLNIIGVAEGSDTLSERAVISAINTGTLNSIGLHAECGYDSDFGIGAYIKGGLKGLLVASKSEDELFPTTAAEFHAESNSDTKGILVSASSEAPGAMVRGILAQATSEGENYGVVGFSGEGSSNHGIYGLVYDRPNCYAVYGRTSTGSGGGYAGYFEGNVKVEGDLSPMEHNSPSLPIAFGTIDEDGDLLSGTDNISSTSRTALYYIVDLSGTTLNSTDYVFVISPTGDGVTPIVTAHSVISGNLYIRTFDLAGDDIDTDLSFVIYKP